MLQIKINSSTILPMRPNAPATFGSPDVPHGTDSCIVKALKVARSNGHNVPAPPTFSEEEVSALIANQESLITVLERDIKDQEGKVIGQNEITDEYLQMFKPSEAEIEAEYYDISTNENGEEVKTPKKANSNDPMEFGAPADLYANLAAAEVALTARLKNELAKRYIDMAIDECLLVPELSEEFKAQFELISTDEPVSAPAEPSEPEED
jgi:hypothetical protein